MPTHARNAPQGSPPMSDSGRRPPSEPNVPDLELSVRSANVAKRLGAATVGELARFTDRELLEAKCFGETTLKEIKEKLAKYGLSRGMTEAQWRGRPGLKARIVTQGQSGATQPVGELER